jgi:hypothetical protein
MRRPWTLFAAVLLLIPACTEPQKKALVMHEVKSTNFSVQVPDNMERKPDMEDGEGRTYLSKDPPLCVKIVSQNIIEFDSLLKSAYDPGLYDDTEVLEKYSNAALEVFSGKFAGASKYTQRPVKFNGLEGNEYRFAEGPDTTDTYFIVNIVKGKENIFQIITFTTKDHLTETTPAIDSVLRSFREI